MGKKQKSVSIPLQYWEDLDKLLKETKNACDELQIATPAELLRVLAKLGKARFLEIVEQVRKGQKQK